MARGRKNKSAERRERSQSLEPTTFQRFVRDVAAAKQELDDAGMAHAGVWKKADPLGIHPEATKLYCRLDKMESTKRNDFLRAFDVYREWAEHWAAQPDMLEEAANDGDAVGVTVESEAEADDGEGAGADEPAEPREPVAAVHEEREPIVTAPEADLGEDGATEATEELTNAGFTFAEGKTAGLAGTEADANPHPETSASNPIWERGRVQGAKERDEPPAEEEKVTQIAGRRRRRAQADEAASALQAG